jgi:glucose-6-phosphate isomerase
MAGQVPLSLEYSYLVPDVVLDTNKPENDELAQMQPAVMLAHETLEQGTGAGCDFLGWLEPATVMPPAQLADVQATAAKLRERTDVMVVIGIGGSYLGARTVIEALGAADAKPVLYAGQTLSADYTAWLLDYLKDKRFCLNVVSKSGTTTEPSVAFRLLRTLLEQQAGDTAKELIVATTDEDTTVSKLRVVANDNGYKTFPVPRNVGGRYSVLTAVGLLPIAYAGIDIAALLQGAIDCADACNNPDLTRNPAYVYAAARNLLYRKGKSIELLACFEPRLHYLNEWWKQLYGESEGKGHMGIFPASVEFTTDLHSMGQYIQEGRRDLFETFINIAADVAEPTLPEDPTNSDGLNFLTGAAIDAINRRAFEGTVLAHREGGVPSMTITLPSLTAYPFGALLYFFMKACGVSGYLLGVNPFNQPGVEQYKKNMFALLKKPGFEAQTAEVLAAVAERKGKHVVEF